MLHLRFILVSTLFLATHTSGQQTLNINRLVGKSFLDTTLEYLEFLNDTILYSSINPNSDTAKYFFRNDTLFIKQGYPDTDRTGRKWIDVLYGYKVISFSDDTFRIKKSYGFKYPNNQEDTLLFVDIEKIKEPVTDFQFLKLHFSSPWSGTKQITIDRLGNVTYVDKPIPYSIHFPNVDKNAKPKNIKGQLTQKEFTNFKNLLSKSLPTRLPLRRDCGLDDSNSNFEILIGKNKIVSSGCNLSWTQAFLLNYLYDLDQNKGLVKRAK